MTRLCLLIVIGICAAGCSMSGPGIAKIQADPGPGETRETTYNSKWVRREPDPINSLDSKPNLGVDISKRELGVRYFDEDTKIEPYVDDADQSERDRAVSEAWRKRMGLKNITDKDDK